MTETDPIPNLPLIRAALTQIKTHPDTWDQSCYGYRTECRTAHCIAGWGIVLSGLELRWQHDKGSKYDKAVFTTEGRYASDVARELFGLTKDEAEDLFDGINSRQVIESLCESIAARAGEALWPKEENP